MIGFWGVLLAVGLFLSMLALQEVGRRLAVRRLDPVGELPPGFGAVEGAIFGLLGLMIGFSFSGASDRLDVRRQQIVQEANAIGTAYLRLDLLPAPTRDALRVKFREYVAARIEVYRRMPDQVAAEPEIAHSKRLQGEIWTTAVESVKSQGLPAAGMLLPALNEMFDITTTRFAATRMHPHPVILVMLGGLALVGALLAGYGMARGKERSLLHTVGFATIMAATIYVILDMEYPRVGFIQVRDFDSLLVEVQQDMR